MRQGIFLPTEVLSYSGTEHHEQMKVAKKKSGGGGDTFLLCIVLSAISKYAYSVLTAMCSFLLVSGTQGFCRSAQHIVEA